MPPKCLRIPREPVNNQHHESSLVPTVPGTEGLEQGRKERLLRREPPVWSVHRVDHRVRSNRSRPLRTSKGHHYSDTYLSGTLYPISYHAPNTADTSLHPVEFPYHPHQSYTPIAQLTQSTSIQNTSSLHSRSPITVSPSYGLSVSHSPIIKRCLWTTRGQKTRVRVELRRHRVDLD